MTFYEVSVASDWLHNIQYALCIMHTYFDLISLPLSFKFFLLFISYPGLGSHYNNFVICGPRGKVNFRAMGGKLAISTIFLVDLKAHFFRNMFSCSWSSEQHLALCLQCVSLL